MSAPAAGPSAAAIADGLRGRIHRGELGPGDRLPPELVLAEQLGVGRLQLREALLALEIDGYLVARRGAAGGRFVTELVAPYNQWIEQMRRDLDALNDIVDFRLAVECEVARLAPSGERSPISPRYERQVGRWIEPRRLGPIARPTWLFTAPGGCGPVPSLGRRSGSGPWRSVLAGRRTVVRRPIR